MTENPRTGCFNLVEEPWLPVTLAEGFPDAASREPDPRVSLREAFAHGSTIVDLRCYPHERIALMRLLICIAQRALNGPDDENDWKSCKDRLAQAVLAYLEEQKACFNLFGDGPRFLQALTAVKRKTFSTQKLRLIDEDGTTLFDRHVQPGVTLKPTELAVGLVAFQSFAAGGRVEGGAGSIPGGLCRESSALHAFLLGTNLSESVWLNLVPRDQLEGTPTIVFGDASWHGDQNFERSYLYRLAPAARRLRLAENGEFVDGEGGRTFLAFDSSGVRELTAAVCTGKGKTAKHELVSATAGGGLPKAAWRELHSIAVLGYSARRGGPLALEHLRTLGAQEAILWCGALVGGGKGRVAKVGDVVESSFRLPIEFIGDAGDSDSAESDPRKRPGPNQTYRQGVELADEWSSRLQAAVQAYYFALQGKDLAGKAKNQAASRFWTALEQAAVPVLLYDVALHSEKYFRAGRRWIEESPWGGEVKRAAWDAYNFACPHTTPRQLRAYAAGSEKLAPKNRPKPRSRSPKEGNDPAEGDEL